MGKFRQAVEQIRQSVSSTEFVVPTFVGWSTVRNEAILGFIASWIDKDLRLHSKVVGNCRLSGRHTANDVCGVLSRVVIERLGGKLPGYFVSDSVPTNSAAVPKFMKNDGGDDYWFPCIVHYCQIAMQEAVTLLLKRIGFN